MNEQILILILLIALCLSLPISGGIFYYFVWKSKSRLKQYEYIIHNIHGGDDRFDDITKHIICEEGENGNELASTLLVKEGHLVLIFKREI